MPTAYRERRPPVLIQKARVLSGDYGHWRVAPEHHGTEVWVVAEPPHNRRFRDRRGHVGEGLVYRRADGLVARAEYLELLAEFRLIPPPAQVDSPRFPAARD
jgi:hypothetical protein